MKPNEECICKGQRWLYVETIAPGRYVNKDRICCPYCDATGKPIKEIAEKGYHLGVFVHSRRVVDENQ